MKVKLKLLFTAVFLCSNEAKVIEPEAGKLDEAVKESTISMVMFSTDWCTHCKALKPEYAKAAELLSKENGEIKLIAINCEKDKEVCTKYEVKGYPTLKIFRGGKVSDYEGDRSAKEIAEYMIRLGGPAATVLSKESDVKEFQAKNPISLIGTFPNTKSTEYEAFLKLAEQNMFKYPFGVLLEEGKPKVTLHRVADEETVFSEDFSEEALSSFLAKNETPCINEIGAENYQQYMTSGHPLVFLFYSTPEEKKLQMAVRGLVKANKDKINFVTIDADKFGGYASFLSLEKKWPAAAIHDIAKKLKYTLQAPTAENFPGFIESFLAGKLQPSFRSQAVPEKNEQPVKMVVRDTFKQLVFDGKKDVLLLVQAQWCPHCKEAMPIFEKLSKEYAKNSDKLLFAQIDGNLNDLEDIMDFEIQGYPTVLLFKAGVSVPVEFAERRTIEALREFILKTGSHQLKGSQEEKAEL